MCSELRALLRRLSRLCDEKRPRTFVRVSSPRLQKSPPTARECSSKRGPNKRKALFMYDIQYHDEVDLTFEFLDSAGNPAPVESQEVLSSNTDVLVVIPLADNMVTIRPTGVIASASVTIRADAQVGSGEDPFFDVVEINVTPGRARRVQTSFGTPRLQVPTTPAPPPPTTTPTP